MLDSDITARGPARDRSHRLTTSLSRYDLTLAVFPTAFLLAVVVSQVFGVSSRVALLGAALAGTLAMIDGIFLNPPTSGET